MKGYISSFIASFVVKNKNITFPIRFLPKYFDISILFDYLIFPLLCVFFNRTTLKMNPTKSIFLSLCFSFPMTLLEIILERHTDLIKYKRNWNWIITYSSLAMTFLFIRLLMSIIRKLNIEKEGQSDHAANLSKA
ncbi:CBO0543 family protein [Bacillus shivajii]|uniref:CBO0543 family protein n=1 Tax=Bacillus shivajii TaxID=1983719 RepID=UPI00299D0C2F|nr:CBO0543 family protein [Bacillus shivajii]